MHTYMRRNQSGALVHVPLSYVTRCKRIALSSVGMFALQNSSSSLHSCAYVVSLRNFDREGKAQLEQDTTQLEAYLVATLFFF